MSAPPSVRSSGRRATLMSSPSATIVTRSEEPPADTSGNVTPVIGSSPMTVPMLTKRLTDDPHRDGERERAVVAGRRVERDVQSEQQQREEEQERPTAPTRPSSSPMMANTKSVSGFGMKFHLPRDDPRPRPKTPPLPSATHDCTSWKPSACAYSSGVEPPADARHAVGATRTRSATAAAATERR
jgi:hypothetical protein